MTRIVTLCRAVQGAVCHQVRLSPLSRGSPPSRRQHGPRVFSCHPQSTLAVCSTPMASRACHTNATSAFSLPPSRAPNPNGTKRPSPVHQTTAPPSSGASSGGVETLFAESPLPAPGVPTRQGPRQARRHHRRRRQHRQRPARTSDHSSHQAAEASLFSLTPGAAREDSAKKIAEAPACATLAPLEAALYQHIHRGEWEVALDILEAHRRSSAGEHGALSANLSREHAPSLAAHSTCDSAASKDSLADRLPQHHRPRQPASEGLLAVSLEERCLWLLLWTGQESAAWQVWLWMQLREERSGSPRPNEYPTNPRLVLLLTLFLYFTRQSNHQRIREMLLLLEVTWSVAKSTTEGKKESEQERSFASSQAPAHVHQCQGCVSDSTPVEGGEESADAWVPLFTAWLQCLICGVPEGHAESTLMARQLFSGFFKMAVERMTTFVQREEPNKAETVALLLLSVHAHCPNFAHNAIDGGFAPGDESIVEQEYWRCIRRREPATGSLASPAASPRATDQAYTAAEARPTDSVRRCTRTAFLAAGRELSQLHHGNNGTARGPARERQNKTPVPPALNAYHFWSKRVLGVMDTSADAWASLQCAFSADPAKSSAASAELLRRIHRATNSRDWETALQLCLGDRSDQREAAKLPWLRRLRKGLTACEAAARSGNGAPWHGAMALWAFTRAHEGQEIMTREYGRIFMLLASATRWAEALRCFHETPTKSLDGFIVSQVGYALRASADRQDRAVLELWAAWRCRVGDEAAPTEEMVAQLLQAMLHAPSSSSAVAGTTTAAAAADTTDDSKNRPIATQEREENDLPSLPAAVSPPAWLPADVATRLLVAAAATTEAAHQRRQLTTYPAGERVPLAWQRHRHVIRRILDDRWTGGWAAALRVALASGDGTLLRSVAPRVPPSHPFTLYRDVTRSLTRDGVELTAADQAALWSLWGGGQSRRGRSLSRGGGVGAVRREVDASPQNSPTSLEEARADVNSVVQSVNLLLDDLLGQD